MPQSARRLSAVSKEQTGELAKVALGEVKADLAIVNGSIVNVYTGEVLRGDTVLIKRDKTAYVGKNTGNSIDSSTQVIDASGKILIPGLIDGHTHIDSTFSVSELVKYAVKGGTTTIITEILNISFALGYRGIVQYLRSARNQLAKIFFVAPSMVSLSPAIEEHGLNTSELRRLLKRKEFVGLGESYWWPVVDGSQRVADLIAETIKAGKKVDGHTSGAKDNKLQAYITRGITSCHEPITAEEVLERLRLGLFVMSREGDIRRDLEAISKIKDENIDFRRLAVSTDGLGPSQLINDGYMDFVVQKAINLGFNPVVAIQMATINIAQRFALDDFIGGIAPGKFADIVIIPDLETIKPEYVISNGRVIVDNGQLIVSPRKYNYPESMQNSIRLPGTFEADDFIIRANSDHHRVKVRVIEQQTDLVTRETIMEIPVSGGQLQPGSSQDLLKVAAIDRTYQPGKTFVGLVKGIGLKHGAIATSTSWDSSDIIVAGANDADMAYAVNRLKELNGGVVVCARGKILAEIALPVGGVLSTEPMETILLKLNSIQQTAANLGCTMPDINLTLPVFTTPAIPFFRICEEGLVDIRQNKFVDLIVG